ncbi:hypothetical protein BJY01DRAFT_246313 [Aspergillus pseudoustus]|uniref:Secreted protein n=1 Tax=Aspergillus pseudoustus TaxID=1810923 RepID=A0ABR4K8F8_9EURO
MRAQLASPFWAVLAVLAVLAMVASALPSPNPFAFADADYDSVSPLWEVAPHPGAAPIFLNGTVEQVYAKLVEINPNYDDDWKDEGDNENAEPGLQTRDDDDYYVNPLTCINPEIGPFKKHVMSGIKYLRKVKGRPHLPANSCGRVSCSWDSAIYWCNDKDHDAYIPSFNNIADGAQVIVNECPRSSSDWATIMGMLTHGADLWRVVVSHPGFYRDGRWC